MEIITFTKINLPYGWLGNMAPYPIVYQDQEWRTSEALFQARRFAPGHPARELIRLERSPMGAKMRAKEHRSEMWVTPQSKEDILLMLDVLRHKVAAHPELKGWLLETGDAHIIEDTTKRPNESGLFWGAAFIDGKWTGRNHLGRLWRRLRDDFRASTV